MPSRVTLFTTLMATAVMAGCRDEAGNSTPPPVPVAEPGDVSGEGTSSEGTVIEEPTEKEFSGLTATVPAGWIEKTPKNPQFIQAEFGLPGEAGEARLTASTAGGGVDANIERWIGQFERSPDDPEPRRETLSVDGRDVEWVDIQGTFSAGMMQAGPPQEGQRLLGAVLPLGEQLFFFKLTGPKETVAAHEEAFRTFIESVEFAE